MYPQKKQDKKTWRAPISWGFWAPRLECLRHTKTPRIPLLVFGACSALQAHWQPAFRRPEGHNLLLQLPKNQFWATRDMKNMPKKTVKGPKQANPHFKTTLLMQCLTPKMTWPTNLVGFDGWLFLSFLHEGPRSQQHHTLSRLRSHQWSHCLQETKSLQMYPLKTQHILWGRKSILLLQAA